jgi:hypothetical protein
MSAFLKENYFLILCNSISHPCLECWTHEEGKGWRRVHVGAESPVASHTASQSDTGDEPGAGDQVPSGHLVHQEKNSVRSIRSPFFVIISCNDKR